MGSCLRTSTLGNNAFHVAALVFFLCFIAGTYFKGAIHECSSGSNQ